MKNDNLEQYKSMKSYTVKLGVQFCTPKKKLLLEHQYSRLKQVGDFVFSLGEESWANQNELNDLCKAKFPNIKTKPLQEYLLFFKPEGKKKQPKHKPPRVNIKLDAAFDVQYVPNNTISHYWIKFWRCKYPLIGLDNLKRIKNISNIKVATIFKVGKQYYCTLTYSIKKDPIIIDENSKLAGVDLNTKRIGVSTDTFEKIYHTKIFTHKKKEFRKNCGKSKIKNYTRNYLHLLANWIIADLVKRGIEVLCLENLKGLREQRSKANGSYNKDLNYLLNNAFPYRMLQDILEYKCLDKGIEVVYVNPAYTSMTCSNCGSLNTVREPHTRCRCLDCGYEIDADIGAPRNIRRRVLTELIDISSPNGPPVNLARRIPTWDKTIFASQKDVHHRFQKSTKSNLTQSITSPLL